jgi:hypothetical protein
MRSHKELVPAGGSVTGKGPGPSGAAGLADMLRREGEYESSRKWIGADGCNYKGWARQELMRRDEARKDRTRPMVGVGGGGE